MWWARLKTAGARPVDVASLVALRVAFGVLALFGAVRFLANGWVDRFFGIPTFFFRYEGFEWVPVPSEGGITTLFVVMAMSAVGIIVGWRYRLSMAAYLVAFIWVELIDVTNYLNHYYLVTLLGALLLCLPLGATPSSTKRWRLTPEITEVPAWMVWLVRFQVGVVYIFAGLAKAGPDWLIHAQPLNLWLSSRTDFPLIGPLFEHHATALIFSWAGFLHDLLIPLLLLWSRTRALAFAALVGFHAMTHLLFNIGMFPFIMTAAATSFFEPAWPRRLLRRLSRGAWQMRPTAIKVWQSPRAAWTRTAIAIAAIIFCTYQVLMPLRTHLHDGDVLWHEQGMRWSWRVMVREKNGTVTYRVKTAESHREKYVSPLQYLTPHQAREFSGQPDMIVALGRHIAGQWRARGFDDVEVRVDALASLNGRPAIPLLDPDADIAAPGTRGLDPAWIEAGPTTAPPIRLPIQLPARVPRSHTRSTGDDYVDVTP